MIVQEMVLLFFLRLMLSFDIIERVALVSRLQTIVSCDENEKGSNALFSFLFVVTPFHSPC